MILRVYWKLQGESVHMRVYAGPNRDALKPAGNLLLSAAEFLELSRGNIQPEFQEVKGEA